MNGQELRSVRKELGWTQRQLSEATGLGPAVVALIERGQRDIRPEELEAIQRVVLSQVGEVLRETGEHPVVDLPEPESRDPRQATWSGLRRGDEVRLVDEAGWWTFLYHYQDDQQEYVQLFGPIPGSVPRQRKPRASHERSVRPERVVTSHKK